MGGRRSDFLKGVRTQLTFQGTQVGKIVINPRGQTFYFRNLGLESVRAQTSSLNLGGGQVVIVPCLEKDLFNSPTQPIRTRFHDLLSVRFFPNSVGSPKRDG